MFYSVGSSGNPVKEIQTALNRAAKSLDIPACPLDVDGKYGKKTQNAVMQFQWETGLSYDGIVGPVTLAALMEYYEPDSILEAAEKCLEVVEALPEYKALEALLYG